MFNRRTLAGLVAVTVLTGGVGSATALAATGAPADAPLGSLTQNKKVVAAAPAPADAPLGSLGQREPTKVVDAPPAPADTPIGELGQREPTKVVDAPPAPADTPIGELGQREPTNVVDAPPAPANPPIGSLGQREPTKVVTPKPKPKPKAGKCRAWRVQGQTWFAGQDNGFTLMFTLRSPAKPNRFGGVAQENASSDPYGWVGSQYLSGGIGTDSKGGAGLMMNIQWTNGTRGQYHATAYDIQPTKSGGLTASLKGTTVDMSGNGGAAARWWADGLEGPWGDTQFIRPLYCPAADVV